MQHGANLSYIKPHKSSIGGSEDTSNLICPSNTLYSSTSDVTSLMGRGSWRFWFTPLPRWSRRRQFGRLPILTLWTLIVIVILYRSLSDTTTNKEVDETNNVVVESDNFQQRKVFTSIRQDQLNGLKQDNSNDHGVKTKIKPEVTSLPNINHGQSAVLTTRKSTLEDYSVRSKVFILIIQDANNHFHHSSQSSIKTSYLSQTGQALPRPGHPSARIPAHLRLLIDILNSHRIEYTVDTTRTGLPTSLLIDQDNSSKNQQYSVIVIDDFLKYTKLNRWIRDQLDRHCRANQIGVVSYLTVIDDYPSTKSRPTGGSMRRQTRGDVTTTEESLANQFPLSFRSINQNNKSCNNISSPTCLVDYQLNELSPILRILKRRKNFIVNGPLGANLDQSPWVSMSSNHITYEPLTWARFRRPQDGYQHADASSNVRSTRETDHGVSVISSSAWPRDGIDSQLRFNGQQQQDTNSTNLADMISTSVPNDDFERQILAMLDRGLYDGIKRVLFGGANHHWLNKIILLDAIEHLSSGKILGPLDRYIQVDIDDIFVGERGTRMNVSDVDNLIVVQRQFAQRIDGGFKFNLGYSGKYYKHGFEQENLGDERLISRANEFTWFCHTWGHSKAHLFNDVHNIVMELRKNLEFARQHKLPVIGHNDAGHTANKSPDLMGPTYAIAPHHSGVYPVHQQLYDAWRQVLNVQVTSTEEYPRLRPASGRRAFVHKAIKVLPRQTCGLYTHTVYKHKYPGGIDKLDASIRGGELFETVLHNPVNIYMSHMSNYANDRLAPYTFSALLDFVETNTNLQLKYAPSEQNQQLGPAKLADLYFKLYPDELQPYWTNPCADKRHLAIWAPTKHEYCSLVPKLLIVGPQKTGTTALYTFLKMNHLFRSSRIDTKLDFEEVQFFNDKHYYNGVDWYLGKFLPQSPLPDGEPSAYRANRSAARNNNNNNNNNDYYYYFDKSATYFDDPKVPKRASYLLPGARIVILLVNPADRAYSWYQHMRAHGDPAANSMSFEQIIMERPSSSTSSSLSFSSTMTTTTSGNLNSSTSSSNNNAPPANHSIAAEARSLRNRCLHPGYYAQHLTKWLDYYPSRQIIIIDGQWFRHNPGSVMNRLQLLLRVEKPLDYDRLLIYDKQKGFYCQRADTATSAATAAAAESRRKPVKRNDVAATKCLGESKGRKYEPMSQRARLYLNRHYWPHNRQLARILSDIGQPLPIWLDDAMSVGRVSGALMY